MQGQAIRLAFQVTYYRRIRSERALRVMRAVASMIMQVSVSMTVRAFTIREGRISSGARVEPELKLLPLILYLKLLARGPVIIKGIAVLMIVAIVLAVLLDVIL
jgi:hypothetical protein